MNAPPIERNPTDQRVADRHPDIPQDALVDVEPPALPCQACNADPGEDCRPWCIGVASQLDLFGGPL